MTADGGPELIQLLTPEGERVHHPEYDVDLTPEDLQREVDEVKELQDRLSTYHIRLLTMKAKATKETK